MAVLALAAPILGERLTGPKTLALVLGFAGALLVSSSVFVQGAAADAWGPLLALTTSVSVAAGNVLAKRMGPQPRLVAIAAWQLLLGSAPLLAASALIERGSAITWDPLLVGLLLFLALAGTAPPTPIWYWLVGGDSDLGQLTLFLFLVPALGLGLGAALFGEAVGTIELVGTAVILSSIVVATRVEVRRLAPRRWEAMPCHCPSLCLDQPLDTATA